MINVKALAILTVLICTLIVELPAVLRSTSIAPTATMAVLSSLALTIHANNPIGI